MSFPYTEEMMESVKKVEATRAETYDSRRKGCTA